MSKSYRFIIYAGLFFLLVWPPVVFGAVIKRLWTIMPVLMVIYTLVFLWFWRINNQKESTAGSFQYTGLDIPILVFAFLAVISFVFSVYKYDSFYALIRLFAYLGLLYLVTNNYSRQLRLFIIRVVITVGAGLSFYGLLQYFGFLSHDWWVLRQFLAATYVNHNHFAGLLELAIPVTLGMFLRVLWLRKKRGWVKVVKLEFEIYRYIGLAVALGMTLLAFVFTHSRGAWVSLGLSLVVANIVMIKRKLLRRESLLILFFALTCVAAFFYAREGPVSSRIDSFTMSHNAEPSIRGRLAIWQATIQMIGEHPWLGVGPGNFRWRFPQFKPKTIAGIAPRYAHNDYLHIAAEMGVPALIFMIFIIVRLIIRGFAQNNNPLIIGCATGLLSLSLHNLVDFNFHIPANMLIFIIYAAIIVREPCRVQPESKKR